MKRIVQIVILSLLISCATSCGPGADDPQSLLIGKWALESAHDGNDAFAKDLEFTREGILYTQATWFSDGDAYEYVIIAPGRLKITSQDRSDVYNYSLDDQILTIFSSKGYTQYVRMTEPTQLPTLPVISLEPPRIAVTPTVLLLTDTPFFTSTPTQIVFTATHENTPTKTMSPTNTASVYITPKPEIYYPMFNCAASQLQVGDSAFVSYQGGKNKIRSTPDTHPSDNVVGIIQPGEVVQIIDGPVCNYGWILWKVRTTRDEDGWTPESDGDEFWLLPLTTRQLCTGALPSRLYVGQNAFVQEEPDLANRVRTEPSTSASIIDRIEPKGKMEILEGPVCGESANWWKVRSLKTGIVGWTMESRAAQYYLAPIP